MEGDSVSTLIHALDELNTSFAPCSGTSTTPFQLHWHSQEAGHQASNNNDATLAELEGKSADQIMVLMELASQGTLPDS